MKADDTYTRILRDVRAQSGASGAALRMAAIETLHPLSTVLADADRLLTAEGEDAARAFLDGTLGAAARRFDAFAPEVAHVALRIPARGPEPRQDADRRH